MSNKPSIKAIREAIETLNWIRRDSTGGTVEENKRTELASILAPHIAKVAALEIPARFARDIESQASAIEYANAAIARWHNARGIILFKAA